VGTLSRPKARAGLAAFKAFFNAASRVSKVIDEARPFPYDVYAQGRAASILGPAWFTCCVGNYKAQTAQFVMPSHTKGQPMPGFLGGSDLAVPIGADKDKAAAWIRAFTDNASMSALRAKGNIPNTTSLLGNSINERAARRSWFVPTAKHWVSVENGNILKTMLSRMLTNQMTIKEAAEFADDNIESTLNQR
jgi:N,N'-diacetylchitobiose transport system substrate-binding protein